MRRLSRSSFLAPKDLSAYRVVARECGYDFRLLGEVMHINAEQRQRFLRKVRSVLWTLKGKRIGVLGLAFKGGTDDSRESPAMAIVESLLAEGCTIQAYDIMTRRRWRVRMRCSATLTSATRPRRTRLRREPMRCWFSLNGRSSRNLIWGRSENGCGIR